MTQNLLQFAKPDHLLEPAYDVTFGPEVADIATLAGMPPYPEQRLCLDGIFAVDPSNPNKSAASSVGVICTRQQLKTGLLKMCALGWLFVRPQELTIWSSHEFSMAQESFADILALLSYSDDLSRRVQRVRTAAGSESIEMKSEYGGARLKFKARTTGGGRGLTGRKVILDEGFALNASMMGALLPTMIAVPDPQVIYASSAGMAKSDVLRGVRDRGRAKAPRMFYAEWGTERRECAVRTCNHKFAECPPGCALDDIELWRQACPITARKDWSYMAAIAILRQELPPEEFMRECLGWWDEPMGDAAISGKLWTQELAPDSSTSDPRFAIDVSPDRAWGAIVAAGRNAHGKMHVEITSRDRHFDYRPGAEWIVQRLMDIRDRRGGELTVHVATGGAAESLVPDIEFVGIRVERVPGGDVVAACGRFYDMAMNEDLAHLGQDELTKAVLGARQKWMGERAFIWERASSATDICPLYAATLATWAADSVRDAALNVW